MLKFIYLIFSLCLYLTCEQESEIYPKHIIPTDPDEPDLNYSEFIFKGGAANQPKPDKEKTGGEDALIFSKNFMAVADGVGGWAQHGIDSSVYSTNLIKNIKEYFYENPEHYSKKPKDLLIQAAVKNTQVGTSTLVVTTLWKNKLKVAFVGDSGYMIFKPELKQIQRLNVNNIIYEAKVISEEQEHGFNFPFQIGHGGDNPRTASVEFIHDVSIGDIVLIMSDGVLDNLFSHEIEFYLNKFLHEKKLIYGFSFWDIIINFDGKEFAQYLLEQTFKKSLNTEIISPFAVGYMKSGLIMGGGKSDDISITCAMIVYSEERMKNITKVNLI